MKTISIENKYTKAVIHNFTSETATIKEAVEDAVKNKISLKDANLENANLENANLENANLKNANLENVNLKFVNLENANLKNANLENVNLKFVNLELANLENANLQNANFERTNLINASIPLHCRWNVSICNQNIEIGCKNKSIEEWDLFFESNEEFSTKRGTKEFKQIYAYYLGAKAYLTELNN